MNKNSDPFENRILLQACILIGIAGLLGTIINLILKIEFVNTALTGGVVLFSFFNLWLIKRHKAFILVRALMSLFVVLAVNAGWYYNFTSYGPMLGLFILIGIFIIFAWPPKPALYISLLLILNIGLLFFLDLQYHESLNKYSNEITRISDVYFGLFMAIIVALFFSNTAKTNYLKKYKEAKKSDELKTIFLQNMSHELRTPLNAIIGFSDIIDEDSSVPQMLKYNKIINTSGNHLLTLVNDLMDITLIESGETRVVKEDINLNIALEDINKLMEYERQYLKKNQLDLILKIPTHDDGIIIYSDHAKLKQLLINLIKNALKFTTEGHVIFGYNVKQKKTKSVLEFFVEDTGIGIKKESLDSVFDVFWQADLSQTRSHRGAGIGLSLSKKLAILLGGDLWVESEVGHGSTFYFEIPCECLKNDHL